MAHAEDKPIWAVGIKITGPTYNQSPKTDFTINTAGVKKAANGAWYNSTDRKWMTSSEKFEIGKDYRFVAYFDLESGYKWGDGEVSVYINSVETSMVGVSGQTYKSAGVVFACEPYIVGYLNVRLAKAPVGVIGGIAIGLEGYLRIVITHDQRTELLSRFDGGIKLR